MYWIGGIRQQDGKNAKLTAATSNRMHVLARAFAKFHVHSTTSSYRGFYCQFRSLFMAPSDCMNARGLFLGFHSFLHSYERRTHPNPGSIFRDSQLNWIENIKNETKLKLILNSVVKCIPEKLHLLKWHKIVMISRTNYGLRSPQKCRVKH